MSVDRRSVLGMAAGAALLSTNDAAAAAEPEVIHLWPETPAGAPAELPARDVKDWSDDPAVPDHAIRGIPWPWIEAFHPKRPNGAAMMVIPGGGYEWVGIEKEGRDIARWLAAKGYTAFVLTGCRAKAGPIGRMCRLPTPSALCG